MINIFKVVLRDVEMINKPPIMRRLIKPWLGNGLLFSEGNEKNIR